MSYFTFVLSFPSLKVLWLFTDGLNSAGHLSMSFFLMLPSMICCCWVKWWLVTCWATATTQCWISNLWCLACTRLTPRMGQAKARMGGKSACFINVSSAKLFSQNVFFHFLYKSPHKKLRYLLYLQFYTERGAEWLICKASTMTITTFHCFYTF